MIEHELKDIACELKAKGCKLRVMTLLREPVERVISSLIYNHKGMPDDQKALNMLRLANQPYPNPNPNSPTPTLIPTLTLTLPLPLTVTLTLTLTRFFAEEQSRYLVAGHSKQWPEAWHQIPKPGFIEEDLVKKVQHALSYVHVVGNTKRLDAVVDKVYTMP